MLGKNLASSVPMRQKGRIIAFITYFLYIIVAILPKMALAEDVSHDDDNFSNVVNGSLLSSGWSVNQNEITFGEHSMNRTDGKRYPFLGRLYSNQIPKNTPPCSGVLVAPNLVLTAYHCINRYGFHATEVEFVTDDNESSVVSSYLYPTKKLPRTMNMQLPIDEILSIQNEDLVLLKLEKTIQLTKPVELFDFKSCDHEKSNYFAVGFPNYQNFGLSRAEKYHSEQKYKYAVLSMLRMEGLAASGMSGGALVVSCEGKDMLAGIIGMGITVTTETLSMIPYLNVPIRSAVFDAQGISGDVEPTTIFELKNRISNNKRAIVDSYKNSSEGIELLCHLSKSDPTLLQSIRFSDLLLSDLNLSLLSCASSTDKKLLDRIIELIENEENLQRKALAIQSLQAFFRSHRSDVKQVLLSIQSDDKLVSEAVTNTLISWTYSK